MLSPGARHAYEEYKYAHDISTARCFHEEYEDDDDVTTNAAISAQISHPLQ
jgi:hypothetical protein